MYEVSFDEFEQLDDMSMAYRDENLGFAVCLEKRYDKWSEQVECTFLGETLGVIDTSGCYYWDLFSETPRAHACLKSIPEWELCRMAQDQAEWGEVPHITVPDWFVEIAREAKDREDYLLGLLDEAAERGETIGEISERMNLSCDDIEDLRDVNRAYRVFAEAA